MKGISVVITAISGEENYLASCLASVKNIASEVIVVDMSTDEEIAKVAKKFGAKHFTHKFVNYVEPVRNFGISKATGEWLLILDPDEEITSELGKKLQELSMEDTVQYLRIPRKNSVFGKWLEHSRWWPDYNIRFFKKGAVEWGNEIHSIPITTGTGIDLEAKENLAIVHHHYMSIDQYLQRMLRYTQVQAELKIKNDYQFTWQDLFKRPVSEFLSRFFVGESYKDGIHGLAVSLLQAFSELVLYLKIWELQKFKQQDLKLSEAISEIKKQQQEVNYWSANALVKQSGGIVNMLKRKFKLL